LAKKDKFFWWLNPCYCPNPFGRGKKPKMGLNKKSPIKDGPKRKSKKIVSQKTKNLQ